MPAKLVEHYMEDMEKMKESPDDYTDSDRSEIIERVGIAQFYYGNYHEAMNYLGQALKAREGKKYSRNNARIQVLRGISKYRTGDLSGAEEDFKDVINKAVKSNPDIAVAAYANMSCVQYAFESVKGAVDNAKKGLELAVKCAKGDKSAQIVLQVARILVSVYLRVNEFAKAEAILYTFKFPKSELVLLQAGTKFAQGNIADATSLVEMHLEARAETKKKKREKEEREAREAEEKARAEEEARLAREEEERVRREEEEKKAKEKEEALARGEVEENDDDSFLSISDEEEEEDEEDNDDSTATGAVQKQQEGEAADETKKGDADEGNRALQEEDERAYQEDSRRRRHLDDLLVEARLVYNLSVLASREYRYGDSLARIEQAEGIMGEYTGEWADKEKAKRKSERAKWRKALGAAHEAAAARAREGEGSVSLQASGAPMGAGAGTGAGTGTGTGGSVDGSLGNGDLDGGAADWLSQSLGGASMDELDDDEGAERDEMQRLMDMPLNVFPPVQTLDAGAEPAVVLSHLLQAKAELQLQMSRGVVESGINVSRGDIVNRGLVYHPDLPAPEPAAGDEEKAGEEGSLVGERRPSHASSITEGAPPSLVAGAGAGAPGDAQPSDKDKWGKMDPAFQEARRLFARSVAVLSESRLQNDVYSTVDRQKREVVDVPGYTDEQTGEEVPPVMKTEVEETPVLVRPFDISLAESAQASYADRMRISAEGLPSLRKVSAGSVSALRSQFGISLNATRGTKAHQKERVDPREYVPTAHDVHTLKAEVLPLVSSCGRDEVALWIEWALSSTQGLGMGLMGLSFNMPISRADALKEKAAEAARAEKNAAAESASLASGSVTATAAGDEASMDTMAQGSVFKNLGPASTIGNKDAYPTVKPSARTAEAFLKEVRGRLSEVEAILSSKYDGNESKYKPGTKELRLLVNGVLARVNVLVKNRRDAELAVELMEELAASMNQRTQNHDPLYLSLAARYRLELEECKVPVGQSDEAQNKSLVELLGFSKAYVKATEAISDCKDGVVIKRDAYKKCINYYNSLASAPLTEKEKPVTEVGTMDVLLCFSDAEIEEKEADGDMTFLRTFGKCRALQLFKRMKKLIKR